MFCTRCGNYISENLQFCTHCGAKRGSTASEMPVDDGPTSYSALPESDTAVKTPVIVYGVTPNAEQAVPVDPSPDGWYQHFLKAWYDFAAAPVSVILAICATLLLLFSFFDRKTPLDLIEAERMAGNMVESHRGLLPTILPVFGILTVIAMWLLYADARNPGPRLNTVGMTILKVIQIIIFVVICLLCGLLMLPVLTLASDLNSRGTYGSMYDVGLGGLADTFNSSVMLLITIVVLIICYQFFVVKTISAMKTTMQTGKPNSSFAMLLGILQIVFGVLSLGAVSSSLRNSFILHSLATEVAAFVSTTNTFNFSSLLTAICQILCGVQLIRYTNMTMKLSWEYEAAHPAKHY